MQVKRIMPDSRQCELFCVQCELSSHLRFDRLLPAIQISVQACILNIAALL